MKKTWVIILMVCVAFFMVNCACADSSVKEQYESAQELLAEKKYQEAKEVFDSLGAYQDAARFSLYAGALAKAEMGLYAQAIADFTALDDFYDSKLRMEYYCALSYEILSEYEKASPIYSGMPGYLDSGARLSAIPEKINERDYAKALRYEEQGKLKEALDAFSKLGSYKDSAERVKDLRLAIKENTYIAAEKAEKEGKVLSAYEMFISLGDYRDSKSRAEALHDETIYDKALSLADEGQYRQAAKLFSELGDYKDSVEKAYVLGVSDFADEMMKPNNGVFVFVHNKLYGFVNYRDNLAFPAYYPYLDDFKYGCAVYKMGDKYGILHEDGTKTEAAWDSIGLISKVNGNFRIHVTNGAKEGYIDYDGNIVLEVKWDIVSDYNADGRCIITKKGQNHRFKDSNRSFTGKWYLFGIADDQGNIICEPVYTELGGNYNDPDFVDKKVKAVLNSSLSNTELIRVMNENEEYGFIDSEGQIVINLDYANALNFSDGVAAVKKGELWGYIDKTGAFVIEPMYDDAYSFYNGRAEVLISSVGWVVIGKDNNRIYYVDYLLQQAQQYMDSGNYEAAAKVYEEMAKTDRTYESKANEAWYMYASRLYDDGKISDSLDVFEKVMEYGDVADRIRSIYYEQGVSLMGSQEYDEAITSFTNSNNYNDAETMIQECHYLFATKLLEDGQYSEALTEFYSISGYKDSEEKIEQIVQELPASNAGTVGEHVLFGHYEQDGNLDNGSEPIEWIVLDVQDNKAFLLSCYVLDNMMYTNSKKNSWEFSYLRKWLNEDFLTMAFTQIEQKAIITTEVNNQEEGVTIAGKNTKDKLYILNQSEVKQYKSIIGDEIRPSAYASSNYKDWCWTRTPYTLSAPTVICNSKMDTFIGSGVKLQYGVLPVIWVDLNSDLFRIH